METYRVFLRNPPAIFQAPMIVEGFVDVRLGMSSGRVQILNRSLDRTYCCCSYLVDQNLVGASDLFLSFYCVFVDFPVPLHSFGQLWIYVVSSGQRSFDITEPQMVLCQVGLLLTTRRSHYLPNDSSWSVDPCAARRWVRWRRWSSRIHRHAYNESSN